MKSQFDYCPCLMHSLSSLQSSRRWAWVCVQHTGKRGACMLLGHARWTYAPADEHCYYTCLREVAVVKARHQGPCLAESLGQQGAPGLVANRPSSACRHQSTMDQRWVRAARDRRPKQPEMVQNTIAHGFRWTAEHNGSNLSESNQR
eukprot:1158572-Pelagomonas_calceolata.AAC.9